MVARTDMPNLTIKVWDRNIPKFQMRRLCSHRKPTKTL